MHLKILLVIVKCLLKYEIIRKSFEQYFTIFDTPSFFIHPVLLIHPVQQITKNFHQIYFANQIILMYFLGSNSAIESTESFYMLHFCKQVTFNFAIFQYNNDLINKVNPSSSSSPCCKLSQNPPKKQISNVTNLWHNDAIFFFSSRKTTLHLNFGYLIHEVSSKNLTL